MPTYKLLVRVLQGKILTFTVDAYSIVDGDFVQFTDRVTGKTRRFHASNVEIEEAHNHENLTRFGGNA